MLLGGRPSPSCTTPGCGHHCGIALPGDALYKYWLCEILWDMKLCEILWDMYRFLGGSSPKCSSPSPRGVPAHSSSWQQQQCGHLVTDTLKGDKVHTKPFFTCLALCSCIIPCDHTATSGTGGAKPHPDMVRNLSTHW